MTATPLSEPLTEQELDRLQDILAAGAAMDVEAMDGYFMALICGPEFVSPNEALQEVLGDTFDFDSDEQAADTIHLLMRHWNWISSELLRCQTEPDVYMPVLLEDDAGLVRGNDWARGFMRGVHARPGTWDDMLHSEQHGGNLLPMLMLLHEHDPDPEMRPPTIADEKRKEVIQFMIVGANRCYRHYEPMRRAGYSSHTPLRRQSPKVGRNDPCPCGSGRKYKHCCVQTLN